MRNQSYGASLTYDVLEDLQDLIQRGVLEMEGKRRGARYRLAAY